MSIVCFSIISGNDLVYIDERLYPEALISPLYYPGDYISDLDLAFLVDTGWYKINHSYEVVKLKETRNKGCKFARMSCYKYMQYVNYSSELMYPYCLPNRNRYTVCSPHDYRRLVNCTVFLDQFNFGKTDMFDYGDDLIGLGYCYIFISLHLKIVLCSFFIPGKPTIVQYSMFPLLVP